MVFLYEPSGRKEAAKPKPEQEGEEGGGSPMGTVPVLAKVEGGT